MIRDDLSYIDTQLEEHSQRCNNPACTIDKEVYDHYCSGDNIVEAYEEICAEFAFSQYKVNSLEALLDELEAAETFDIQKINELQAGIESMFWNYEPYYSSYLEEHMADIAAVESYLDSYYRYCHVATVVIPVGVTSIDRWEFNGYSGLTSIVIPNSVTTIGYSAFDYCHALTTITFMGTVEQWNAISKESIYDYHTADYTVYCTDGTITKNGTVTYY